MHGAPNGTEDGYREEGTGTGNLGRNTYIWTGLAQREHAVLEGSLSSVSRLKFELTFSTCSTA